MIDPVARITGKARQSKELTEDDIPLIHHTLMKEYGWIPLGDLKSLPLPTLWGLWNCIQSDRKREQDEYEKAKRKVKR